MSTLDPTAGPGRTSPAERPEPGRLGQGEPLREIFVFGRLTWDVTAGLELARNRPLIAVDITDLRLLLPFVRIDPAWAAVADLARPLLIAPVPELNTNLPLDGWHRVHRALHLDVGRLPARLLTAADERRIRLQGD